ncbi:hypothetical protein JNM05_16200 [bacterium]|nr:hypothetical protein [bacterium]
MSLSLRTKFILVFVFLGLFMAAATSAVFYLSFDNLIRAKMKSDLANESQEFADYVRYEKGRTIIEPSKEWQELEHLKNSDYSRYILVTDTAFTTLHKSENLGRFEFQSFHKFLPTEAVESYDIDMDSVKYFCVVFPIRKNERIIGYVLAAENYRRTAYFLEVFERTIFISLVVLILISFTVAVFFANRVTRPLLAIQQVAGRIDLQSPGRRIELKDSEKEIENLSDSLNRLFDRLEKSFSQINEFSSNVSHELRTPLTVLRGNIEVSLTKDRTSEEYIEILSGLLEETLHVIRIVDDLLLLARADAKELRIQTEPIHIEDFCLEFSKDWEMICAMRKQTLRCEHEPGIVIEADKNLLYQLFLNIISNASKFTAGTEPIDVSIKKQLAENGKTYYAEIVVTDRGIGISGEDSEHVFDRFYRVQKDRSRETGGTGLGLSICKMIAELHHGTISLKSKEGFGTSVTVRIPATNNLEIR